MQKDFIAALMLLPATAIIAPAFAADYMTAEQAQRIFYPNATKFVNATLHLSDDQRETIKDRSGVRQRTENQTVWQAEENGKPIGWVFVDDVIGKHEFITYAAAISLNGEVIGIEILSYRETHGGQIRDAIWRENFKGKTLNAPWRLGQDVPNISGATLSCRNVMDGVKRLLIIHELHLKHG